MEGGRTEDKEDDENQSSIQIVISWRDPVFELTIEESLESCKRFLTLLRQHLVGRQFCIGSLEVRNGYFVFDGGFWILVVKTNRKEKVTERLR